jgi:hypothetical protein
MDALEEIKFLALTGTKAIIPSPSLLLPSCYSNKFILAPQMIIYWYSNRVDISDKMVTP